MERSLRFLYPDHMGILIASIVIIVWAAHLAWMLFFLPFSPANPWMYFHIILQAYLYTGLFITGHDAMHGNISRSKAVNTFFGNLSTYLFAGLSYKRLRKNHGLHHKDPATGNDPDFFLGSQNFWKWWAVFMWRYLSIIQLLIMALVYNLLILRFEEIKVLIYWALPALLGTLQLFYVGVYWPHRKPHLPDMEPHKARTQKKNHLWAMISCYFFGYHSEHHHNPRIPWWQLYRTK
ncbi:MAG: fatty acid desaturase [Bacteroidales bacterium]